MFAFETYRSDTWHEPLSFDGEISAYSNEGMYARHRNSEQEPYEAWFNDSRVLTMEMLNEVYLLSAAFAGRQRFNIKTGEMAFVVARFPKVIKRLTEEKMSNLRADEYMTVLRNLVAPDEAFAWFLLLDFGRWCWGDDNRNDLKVSEVEKLCAAGIGFDIAQPYISSGVAYADDIIGAIANDIDASLLVSAR